MILFKRRHCRKHGHDFDSDPGVIALHCHRCKAMVDFDQFVELVKRAETVRGELALPGPVDCNMCSGYGGWAERDGVWESCRCTEPDQWCPLCREVRPCIHNIAPERFCSCGCGNPVGDS